MIVHLIRVPPLGFMTLQAVSGVLSLIETGDQVDVYVQDEDAARRVSGLAARMGWSDSSGTRILALLTEPQRATPLASLFTPSKSGVIPAFGLSDVEVISESAQGLRRRQYVLAYDDVGASAFGEPAVRPGAVPGAIIEYRYRLTPAGLVEGEGRVRYPLADGSGDLDPIASLPVARWGYQGSSGISAGQARRRDATTRAGYLLGVGAVVGLNVVDPGPAVTALIGGLSLLAKYDVVAAYERSGDPDDNGEPRILAMLAAYPLAWLDTPLGPGITPRSLALAELADPTTDADGWTPWPT